MIEGGTVVLPDLFGIHSSPGNLLLSSVRANTDQEPVAQPKLCCASFAQLAAGCSPALIVNEAVIGARSRREGPPMTTRITKSIVTFDHAFALGQYSDILPAGDYEVVLEEERLQGPSFEAYRRSATYLTVTDKIGRNAGRTELRPITERDLEIALSGDRALTLGGQEGKEPFQSQEDLP